MTANVQPSKLLLILGVSAVGKSSLIRELKKSDSRFVYISPFITRALREGENDKIAVSDLIMDEMNAKGEFICVNELYGTRYGTPRRAIFDALDMGQFPVLDWPVKQLNIMKSIFGERLYSVYVYPPDIQTISRRLEADGRDIDGNRFRAAVEELAEFWAGMYSGLFNMSIISTHNRLTETSFSIYSNYLSTIEESKVS